MLPKTLSENLDLILKYRSYNIIADPVAINDIEADLRWPRNLQYVSTPVTYGAAGSTSYFNGWTVDITLDNTYTGVDPVIPAAERPQIDANKIFPGHGYFNIRFWVTLSLVRANELYTISLEFQRAALPPVIVGANTMTTVATGPTVLILECTWSGYVTSVDTFQLRISSSDGAGFDATARAHIVKITPNNVNIV